MPTYDRTAINSWEDSALKQVVQAVGRRKRVMTALWTEACLTFPALHATQEGYDVHVLAGDDCPGSLLAERSLGPGRRPMRRRWKRRLSRRPAGDACICVGIPMAIGPLLS
ncbi:isochorismatase family protein [Rhodobium gokarnense]|uniref:isochorismatase family protein n=1 Tax=Rhodobium gokarnense TaxID=364296 RepID=UPI0038739692